MIASELVINNQLKLGFSRATLERKKERLPSFGRPYLTEDAVATVARVSEKSDEWWNATA